MKKILIMILAFAFAVSLVACVMEDTNSGVFSQGRLYFNGTKEQALLVDDKGNLTWLYSEDAHAFESFDSGDLVSVEHGILMETYPGQTYVSHIELVEDGDVYSFTDDEWERLCAVFVEPPER